MDPPKSIRKFHNPWGFGEGAVFISDLNMLQSFYFLFFKNQTWILKFHIDILIQFYFTRWNCFEMLHKSAQKLDSQSCEKNDGTSKSIPHLWSWKESHPTSEAHNSLWGLWMLPDWSNIVHTLKISLRVSINAQDLYKDALDGEKGEHTEMEGMSLTQPAVMDGFECASTLHSDLILGKSQRFKKQNVLAVRSYPLIQRCHDCTSKCWKKIEPSESQTILYQTNLTCLT